MSYLTAFKHRKSLNRDLSANYQRNRIKKLIPKTGERAEARKVASSRVLPPLKSKLAKAIGSAPPRKATRRGIFDEVLTNAVEYEQEITAVLGYMNQPKLPVFPSSQTTPLLAANLDSLALEESKLERTLRTLDRRIKRVQK